MTKYNTFLTLFIIYCIAFFVLMGVYLNSIFSLMGNHELIDTSEGISVFKSIFTSAFMISGFIAILTSLTFRILGIVHVAKNKTVTDGEKALWIVGFIIMGFVTAIVFLIMAKGRKYME
ncbi:MAG: hypothetical protein ABI685_14740 [Ferruginibacter sp.]